MTDLKTLENLKEKLNWNKEEMDNLFFPVLEEKNILRGKKTGTKTLFREMSSGDIEIISTMGNGYSIVENQYIHNTIQEVCPELNLNLSLSSIHKNKKTVLVYDIGMKEADITNKNDEDGSKFVKLITKNSYDGTSLFSLELGVYKLLCRNGMSVPVGEVVRLQKKHIGIDHAEFKKNIKNFLMKVINSDNFKKIKNKIETLQKEKEMHIPFSLLKSLPKNQSFPILEGIKKYSTENVFTSHKGKNYKLTIDNDIKEVKKFLIGKIKSERSKKRTKTELLKAKYIQYNEQIANQWALYNFIVKVVQYKIQKSKRFEIARKIANQML